jgi:hypothetical protein
MIHINFSINNPWRWPKFHHSGNIHGKITKNKSWELEYYRCSNIVEFNFNFTVRQDHAGCELTLGLLGNNIHANIYDRRHWDNETNSWKEYENSI